MYEIGDRTADCSGADGGCSRSCPRSRRVQCRRTGHAGALACGRRHDATTDLCETRALTSRPFGVNLNLDFPQEERLAVCLEERVPIISFFWRDPIHLVRRAKEGGAIVMHTVGSAADAKRAMDAGVDIVVAQGWEAGGHICGTVATMPLIPAVVDAVSPAPVVAAGGIADGRGLAAALALGAAGAWIGIDPLPVTRPRFTLIIASVFCRPMKQTRFIWEYLFDVRWPNAPHRTLRNQTVRTWEATGRPPSGKRPGEGK